MDALPARLLAWFNRRTAVLQLSAALLVGMAGVLAYSLRAAAWVPDSSPLLAAVWSGLLLGGLAAAARWSGRRAALYHLAASFLWLSVWVGKITQPLGQAAQPVLGLRLEMMQLRLYDYLARLGGWVHSLAGGGSVADNGLFLLLIGLLAWWSAAWLAWAVLRRRRAFEGLLPATFLLAVNIHLSDQPVDGLWIFLGCAVLLAARTAMIERYASWQQRQVDYPDELSWSWSAAALALGLVILLAARLSPLFGTPDGWKTLGDYFRDAQQRLSQTTTRLFGDVAPPPPRPEDALSTAAPPAPRAITPALGLIGLAPTQSSALVMWVQTDDPPPPAPPMEPGMPPETQAVGPSHYWRSAVFAAYTGSGWEGLELSAVPPASAPAAAAGRYLLTQTVEIAAGHDERLFAASIPAVVEGGVALTWAGPDATPLVVGSVDRYRVQSWVPQVNDVLLRAAPPGYPAEIAAYLQLPPALPQRVRDLARRVVGGAPTAFDAAVRLQDYLRLSYRYTLQTPPPPAGQDAVDYFLFDAPGGFCSYYASAMVVMLRSQGIAARVASGYATGSYDFTRQAYRVTPSDAHAWVEVYFAGYGWVEFEPTAALARIPYETPAGSAAAPGDALPARPAPPAPAWQGIVLIALVTVALIGGWGSFFWLRARRPATAPPALLAERHYRRLRAVLGWAGLRAPPSTTPGEFLRQCAPALRRSAALPALLAQATALYQQALYSPRAPSLAAIQLARRQAARRWGDFAALVLRRGWDRLRGKADAPPAGRL